MNRAGGEGAKSRETERYLGVRPPRAPAFETWWRAGMGWGRSWRRPRRLLEKGGLRVPVVQSRRGACLATVACDHPDPPRRPGDHSDHGRHDVGARGRTAWSTCQRSYRCAGRSLCRLALPEGGGGPRRGDKHGPSFGPTPRQLDSLDRRGAGRKRARRLARTVKPPEEPSCGPAG
jgi:hypothetical protein